MSDVKMTTTLITFVDINGRPWRAVALISPLKSPGMDPLNIEETKNLALKVYNLKIVGGKNALSG